MDYIIVFQLWTLTEKFCFMESVPWQKKGWATLDYIISVAHILEYIMKSFIFKIKIMHSSIHSAYRKLHKPTNYKDSQPITIQ